MAAVPMAEIASIPTAALSARELATLLPDALPSSPHNCDSHIIKLTISQLPLLHILSCNI